MFAIGPSLREARLRRGFSLPDVQKATRIRERYLAALEDERFDLLPGEAYARGFLRSYAEFLGLESRLYLEEYAAQFPPEDEPPLVPESLAHRPRRLRRLGGGALVVAVVLAAAGGLVAWQMSGGSAGTTPPLPVAAPVAAAAPAAPSTKHARPQAKHAKPAAPRPAPVASIAAARGVSWVRVRVGGPAGTTLYEGFLRPGKSLWYRLKRPLWVRVGAPWNLDVRIAGHAVGGLPSRAGDVLLTPTGLRGAA